jgi:hypothetical protein
MQSLPGWTTRIQELSNNHWMITLTDKHGRIAEYSGYNLDETLAIAITGAFDIEKQVSANWGQFLYELCLSHIPATTVVNKYYDQQAGTSWSIEIGRNRLQYLGNWLLKQMKDGDNWFDAGILRKEQTDYSILTSIMNNVIIDQ